MTFPVIAEDIAGEVKNQFFPAEESKLERLWTVTEKQQDSKRQVWLSLSLFSCRQEGLDLKKHEIHSTIHH